MRRIHLAFGMLAWLAGTDAAQAVTDEIQVYTGEIVAPGVLGLTLHNNYTPDGVKAPDHPGGLVDDQAYSSVAEWAYGVTDWFEAGLYLPLYSNTATQGWTYNGFKLRALFVQPDNGDKDFYYGVNFEFSWNQKQWDSQVNTGEIRPIVGWRFGPDRRWSITFNPIVDNSYKGGIAGLEFVPATRLDYAVNKTWTVALEEYDDFGQLRHFLPADQQSHQLWGAVDYTGDPVSVEAGVGFGLTPATDDIALKLMLMSDLTGPHGLFGG
ncbi:MAG: hypothetical protein BGN85_01890 [Alphaproteobacteria bacterium 64-11]|nr:transporter [Alphaproteobacteria bacterium]OJU09782.1 MAG: hypothetical protein BGN85_01890 [Alphaproteobacteria bacterium 64-11]